MAFDVMISLLIQSPRLWKYHLLSDAKEICGRAILRQPTLFTGKGKIAIGSNVVIGTKASPYFYSGYSYIESRERGAVISIGDRVWANNNLVIICNGSTISIGEDTLIGWNVQIIDSDFHRSGLLTRRAVGVSSNPIFIEGNVWLGSNVIILKGVTIGANSIIANGAVVSSNIPENVVAAGVPARVVKEIERE